MKFSCMKRIPVFFGLPVLLLLSGCYKCPDEFNVLKNPNTPENWSRIKYSEIPGSNTSYINFFTGGYIYDENEKLYILSAEGDLLVFEDSSHFTLTQVDGVSGYGFKVLRNSENEIFISQSYHLKKLKDGMLYPVPMTILLYNYWGEPEETSDFQYKDAVIDSHDRVWLINNYYDLYRQKPNSTQCEYIPDSLYNLDGYAYIDASKLFLVNNEVWVINDVYEIFRFSELNNRFEYLLTLNNGSSLETIKTNGGTIYLLTTCKLFTITDNQLNELPVNIYDEEGYRVNLYLDDIDFDHRGNILINTYEMPLVLNNDSCSQKDPSYYEDDYRLMLHLGQSQHLIIGGYAMYINNL
jgi:hypothetical protein